MYKITRWIGEHPRLILAATAFVCTLAFVTGQKSLSDIMPPDPDPAWTLGLSPLVVLLLLVVPPVVMGGVACLVGCIVFRAGLGLARFWIHWLVLASMTALTVASVVIAAEDISHASYIAARGAVRLFFGYGSAWVCEGVFLTIMWIVATVAGLSLARSITRWMIDHGKWEVTVPFNPAEADEEP